tara:strand:+ start:3352 stop:3645 length:294 start_codon:yes stop_codon:yes gene_type:complete
MKIPSFIFYASLLGLVGSFLVGCVSGRERTTLADGASTETRVFSFWSDSAIDSLKSSKNLTPDSYERKTGAEGLQSKADTAMVNSLIAFLAERAASQ